MSYFVIIEPHGANVPADQVITAAMTQVGGTVVRITPDGRGRRVEFTGVVNHNRFENALASLAHTKVGNWEFQWADAAVADATAYQIAVTMSQETLDQLVAENYFLYAFKAVRSTQQSGAPLVWFKLGHPGYSESTVLDWQVQYQAYTSTDHIVPDGHVTATFHADIELGQMLHVQTDGGDGEVLDDGTADVISILNETNSLFACGIAAPTPGGAGSNPICAFPLHGQSEDLFAPIEKVLLMFSTAPVNTGTVIEQAYSSGVLVNVTGGIARTVNFEIETGWSWGGGTWAVPVKPAANLVPLLIESQNAVSQADRLAS